MTRIEIKSRVGPDGVLDLKVPVGPEEANREVIVTVQPLERPAQQSRDDWQKFLDETYGACAGLGLEVPPDLPLQEREW